MKRVSSIHLVRCCLPNGRAIRVKQSSVHRAAKTTVNSSINNVILENGFLSDGILSTMNFAYQHRTYCTQTPQSPHNTIPNFETAIKSDLYAFWKSNANQKHFFNWLGKEYDVKELDDWYEKLSKNLILQNGGISILFFHDGSPINALTSCFPEHNWNPSKFKDQTTSESFWKELSSNRKFFDDLGKKLGLSSLDDWYQKLSRKVLWENNGSNILASGSPIELLKACYPDHKWIPWRFSSSPVGFWHSVENQKYYFDWLGSELGVKKLDDWFDIISQQVLEDYGGASILCMHNRSIIGALKTAYPLHNWIPWKFKNQNLPRGYLKENSTQRKFFDELGAKLGVKNLDDWYEKLSATVIIENGGKTILDKQSPVAALKACYPEHEWIPWKFQVLPEGFWRSIKNRRQFFDWLGKQLGVKYLDDWYKLLNVKSIEENGGSGLLKNKPVAEVLMGCYPEHTWAPWKFKGKSLWKSQENITEFMKELSEKLQIRTLDDWYRVDLGLLKSLGAGALLQRHGGLYQLLKQQYPHHSWDNKQFKGGRKTQRWLVTTLQKIFPNEEIIEDYQHPKAVFSVSKRPIQLDVFIPSKSLAFEYQGEQHYQDVGVFSPSSRYQQRDEEKRKLCAENNIRLIEVPFWWNRTEESLQEMIQQANK